MERHRLRTLAGSQRAWSHAPEAAARNQTTFRDFSGDRTKSPEKGEYTIFSRFGGGAGGILLCKRNSGIIGISGIVWTWPL